MSDSQSDAPIAGPVNPIAAMTQEDYIWVAIKIFGLYVILHAFFSLVVITAATIMVIADLGEDEISSLIFASSMNSIVTSGISLVVYVLVGLYLLRGGQRVFNWVNLKRDSR